jgi:hypothetical protein
MATVTTNHSPTEASIASGIAEVSAKHSLTHPQVTADHNPTRVSTDSSIATLPAMNSFIQAAINRTNVASLSLKSSPTKGAITLKTLADFGISSRPSNIVQVSRDSKLKCCIIRRPGSSTIVFRIHPDNPKSDGAWAEKLLADAVHGKKNEQDKSVPAKWTELLNFQAETKLFWYHNNVPQKNGKGYTMRMFAIPSELEIQPKDNIIALGYHICSALNNTPTNTTTIRIDEQSFFWLEGKPVWSDIVGYEAALRMFFQETEQLENDHPAPAHGYYNHYKDIIHSYFHPCTFSEQLASILQAPPEQLHPSLRQGRSNLNPANHCSDDNHEDHA